MDAITHEYHWNDREKYYSDYQYLDSLYEKKLALLSQKLGKMHGVTTNIRFWRIIIGPWLRFFIDSVFDRYENVRSLKELHKIENTSMLQYKLSDWAQAMDIKLMYIQPGKPTQNAYIERFNRTVRQECLNLHLFDSVESAQNITTQWLWIYSNQRWRNKMTVVSRTSTLELY